MKPDSDEPSSSLPSDRDELDPGAVRRAIRCRAEGIERRELERALDRLEASGTTTIEQRRIVMRMATAIVDGMLSAPESMLADDSACDLETLRAAVALFDPE